MRQLRHLPDPAGVLGRHGRGAEAAVDGVPAAARARPAVRRRPGRSTSCSARRPPKVTEHGHDSLTVFGIGTELSEAEWRGVVRQLLAQGLLAVEGDYGTLVLTEGSARGAGAAARGHAARASPSGPRAAARAGQAAAAAAAAAELPPAGRAGVRAAAGLARRPTAKEQGVPAYVIFHDATLRQIAAQAPATLAELSDGQRRRRGQAGQVRPAGPGHAGRPPPGDGRRRSRPSDRLPARAAGYASPAAGRSAQSIGCPAESMGRAGRPVTEEASVTSDWFQAGAR